MSSTTKDEAMLAGAPSQPAPRRPSLPARVERRRRQILRLMREGNTETYDQLAARFGCGWRTIARDVAAIRPQLMADLPPLN